MPLIDRSFETFHAASSAIFVARQRVVKTLEQRSTTAPAAMGHKDIREISSIYSVLFYWKTVFRETS
jgi:hypothetical protein